MNTLINLIIIGFIINIIYKSMKQIEKQKNLQEKSREKIILSKRTYKHNLPKTNKNVITKLSNAKLIKTDIQETKASVNTDKRYENTDAYEHIEEYESQMQTNLFNFNLAGGIIMSEILAPPISKRGHQYRRRRRL